MRPRQVSDHDILAAARRCILQHGPSVSTTVIAQEVGLSQAALFKRFGTKDDLVIRALMPVDAPAWILHVEKGLDERPAIEQLRDIAGRMALFFDEMIPCLSMLRARFDPMDVMKRHPDPPPIRGRAALVAWFEEALTRGLVRPIEPQAAAQAFIGALHGRAFMRHVASGTAGAELESADEDLYVDHLLDVLWHGLAPEGTPS